MVSELINANPIVYERKERRARSLPSGDADEYALEPIDQQEVFDILSLALQSFLLLFFCAFVGFNKAVCYYSLSLIHS